jgi:hypothetical protein
MSGCDINNDFVQSTFAVLSAANATTADVRLSQSVTQLPLRQPIPCCLFKWRVRTLRRDALPYRGMQNDVFYWTSQRVRQVINQNFENTTSLAKDYMLTFKKQDDRHFLLRLLLAATTVAPLSRVIEQLILFQWTYIIGVSEPIKK